MLPAASNATAVVPAGGLDGHETVSHVLRHPLRVAFPRIAKSAATRHLQAQPITGGNRLLPLGAQLAATAEPHFPACAVRTAVSSLRCVVYALEHRQHVERNTPVAANLDDLPKARLAGDPRPRNQV